MNALTNDHIDTRAAEDRFLALIQHNADGIVVVDADGFIRFANAAATRLFGRPLAKLIGSPFGFPVVGGETTEVEVLAHGNARSVEMRVVATEWERAPAFIASLRDITERKAGEYAAQRLAVEQSARAAAEDAASRLRFLLDSSTVLSSSLDADAALDALARLCLGRISDWTVVYTLGDDGRPRRAHVHHRDPAKEALALELQTTPILPTGSHPVLEVVRTRRGRIVPQLTEDDIIGSAHSAREAEVIRALDPTSYMIVPIAAHERVFGALALVSSDTSRAFTQQDMELAADLALRAGLAVENARLYEEAREANSSKANFLAVVSHDLRTPLNAILGYSELLELGIPEALPANSRPHVKRIRTSANHLVYLLDQLLDFARLDAGGVVFRPVAVDVRDVLREVRDVIDPLAAERGLRLIAPMPPEPVGIVTDPNLLRQVLLNLAGNAVKYTREGTVHLAVEHSGETARIMVRDTGIGISPEHHQRIFEPFWQVDPNERARRTGTGLGLSVVARLVTLLGGRLSLESSPGRGSEFTVWLPVRGGEDVADSTPRN